MKQETLPRIIQTRTVYRSVFDLCEDLIVDRDGDEHSYCRLVAKTEGVIILPEINLNCFLLTKEYRYPVRKEMLSCPGGSINPQESPLQAAQRELLEETGYAASTWTPLHFFYPFPAICTQKVYIYLAQNLEYKATPHLDPLEQIDVKPYHIDELMQLDFSSSILDGVFPTAFFLYKQHLSKLL